MIEDIASFDNLLLAFKKASKGKSERESVMRFSINIEDELLSVRGDLISGRYTPLPYRSFAVHEPKMRTINAPAFRDRVVHHAIVNIIGYDIDKRFIYDSYACRSGKGTHAGVDRAQKFIRKVNRTGKVYALKADILKYFKSIDHDVLKEIISKNVICEKTIALLFKIIDSREFGIPLGNLTSQLFVNMYLNELDQYIKHAHREKYYIRYMDDFVIISNDKERLQFLRVDIENFLNKTLRIKTNSKTQVFPVGVSKGRSLDFLGYRIYATHRLLRKNSVNRIKRKAKAINLGFKSGKIRKDKLKLIFSSWIGHASHANTHNLKVKLLKIIKEIK